MMRLLSASMLKTLLETSLIPGAIRSFGMLTASNVHASLVLESSVN